MTTIPQNVQSILDSLSSSDQEIVLNYIQWLHSQIPGKVENTNDNEAAPFSSPPSSSNDDNDNGNDKSNDKSNNNIAHPKYDPSSKKEDYDSANTFKQDAMDAKSSGDYHKALKLYNQAIMAAPPSAVLYANRAMVLEQLGYSIEAVQDCTWALELNPDSVKALKVRGKLRYHHLNDWSGALNDLNQAQTIDFDPDVATILKELTEWRKQQEQQQAQERLHKEEMKRKRAEEIQKAKQEQQNESNTPNRSAAGMPSTSAGAGAGAGAGGMPGGAGGMSGGGGGAGGGMDPGMMAGLMSDPELQEAMKNPKVVSAFQELMNGPGGPMGLLSNPGKLQELMGDPDVGPVLQKLMNKFTGGGGGAGAGMGGMPGMGGMGGNSQSGAGSGSGSGGDDIPDLGEMPDLD